MFVVCVCSLFFRLYLRFVSMCLIYHTRTQIHTQHRPHARTHAHTHTFGAVDKLAAVSSQERRFVFIYFSGAVGELAAVSSEERRC